MKHRKLWTGAGLALLTVAGVLVASLGATVDAATVNVTVRDDSYDPSSITIAVGDTVTWNFNDPDSVNPHSVTSTGAESFDSGVLNPGAPAFSRTFAAAGSFGYECSVHGSSMSGTVNVQAANTATATATSTADDPTATRTTAATSTAGPSSTPAPGATATPVDAMVISAPADNAPAAPAGGAAPTTTLPRAGSGSDGTLILTWIGVVLALGGALSTGAAVAVQRIRRE